MSQHGAKKLSRRGQ